MVTPILLAGLVLVQETDTTVAVRQGAKLDLNNHSGTVVVRAWNRSEVRIQASHGTRDRIDIEYAGNTLSVRANRRHGHSFAVDYQITVPEWMKVAVTGVEVEISVEGTRAAVSAESVEGMVTVRGGAEFISAKSVDGDVIVEGARGHVMISAIDGAVTVRNVVGDVTIEAVDGDITLTGIDATNVDASTVDGMITYEGTIKNGGSYAFSSHDGDLDITIPDNTSAAFSVSTFSGEFEPQFPIQADRVGNRRIKFTIGTGSARVDLESFDGTIVLKKAGARRREE
jgi:DUF4097 and DUF4098 domain-containing protein YvlB